jgi:chemotaxis family two-component system response regulator Rcp1
MRILLVEDNPAEALLTREALSESGVVHELCLVEDGEMATSFLRQENGYGKELRPDLVVLDQNLPRKNGRQVLREIKEDPSLASIPIIVITNSVATEDVEHVYRLRANCYIVKPPDVDEFFAMMHQIIKFWAETVLLPDGSRAPLSTSPDNHDQPTS